MRSLFVGLCLGLHAVVGIPLKSGTQITGVLGLAHLEEGRTFGTNEIELLGRFAQLASIALDNARLYSAAHQELIERNKTSRMPNHRGRLCVRDEPIDDLRRLSRCAAIQPTTGPRARSTAR